MKRLQKNTVTSPGQEKSEGGPLLEPDLGGELVGERLVAGPGSTGPEKTTWSHLPVGSPPAGRVMGVGCIVYQAVGKSGVLGVRIPSSADWF